MTDGQGDHPEENETADFVRATGALKMRCPHCHNPVEILELPTLGEISCPSCQSVFTLTPDSVSVERQVGRQLGHFELLEQLGAGTFGAVWKARDTELDRIVAVKIPRRTQLDAEDIEKFVREARSAAQLKHPNIVGVHEVGREGETVYIVSDYIEGLSLDKWLSGQQLTPKEAAALCQKIAIALHHAHEAGVVHRDLKPGNIMMDGAGEPHVMDFGLAKREAGEITMTQEGQILGTPAYMSPEQAKGEGYHADRRSDVYSLGVILFELLTGERPFRGSNMRMLLTQVIEDEAPSPRKFDNRIPQDLETVTLKCLEKEPTKRYPTAIAFGDELRRFQRGEPIRARKISRTARAWRWCKRNPVVAGLAVAVVLVLCTGIVATTFFALAERRQSIATSEALKREAEQREALMLREYQEARRLYYTYISQAKDLIDHGRYTIADQFFLNKTREDVRDWEYALLHTAVKKGAFSGHERTVNSVAFGPEGKKIVSGSLDNKLIIWDVATGEKQMTLMGHAAAVNSVAFSLDGSRIVSGSNDNTLKIWDANTGHVLATLEGHAEGVNCVAFRPDGKRIVSGSDDDTLKVWDAESYEEVATLEGHTIGETYEVNSVAFSPDGDRIVSGSSDDTLKVWDARSHEELATLIGHQEDVTSVAFRPDGKRIVSGSADDTLKIWDTESFEKVATLEGHTKGETYKVNSVAFSPDGDQIVSGSTDATVKVWDAASGEEFFLQRQPLDRVASVAFSPDGKQIAGAAGIDLNIWDLRKEGLALPLTGHTHFVNCVAFSPDGKRIVSGSYDQALKIWDRATGQETLELKGHASAVLCVSFDPRGTRIVSGSSDKTVKIWDAELGEEMATLEGHQGKVSCVAFSPDGKQIVSGSEDDTLKVWNAATGKEIVTLEGHTHDITSVAFSPDGERFVSGSRDGTLKVWDATMNKELATLGGHRGFVTCIAFSKDGNQIVSGSFDRTLKLWRVKTGLKLKEIDAGSSGVTCVSYCPSGKRILSGSVNGVLSFWDIETDREVLSLAGHETPDGSLAPVTSVKFSPDGKQMVSAAQTPTLKMWDASLID